MKRRIYNTAIEENKICVYEGRSAEVIPNYELDFVVAAIRAIRENPLISEIDLVGMSDLTIQTLIPSIAMLQTLQELSLSFNYITLQTAVSLVGALNTTSLKSVSLLENEFFHDNRCPAELARALLALPHNVCICIYSANNFIEEGVVDPDEPPLDNYYVDQNRMQLMADSLRENAGE